MNGVHDLGGMMHGHGPVVVEEDEPTFHSSWERQVMGMSFPIMAAAGIGIDEFRHAIERMPAADYLATSYYEHWLHAFECLLVEKGVVTQAEIDSGRAKPGSTATPVLTADMVSSVLAAGGSTRVAVKVQPRFKVGDRVRTRNINPPTHTRLPRYARDKIGTVEIDHGVFHTPDTMAHGLGQKPQHVYSVAFSAQDIWGADANPRDTIRIDMWDDYLTEVRP